MQRSVAKNVSNQISRYYRNQIQPSQQIIRPTINGRLPPRCDVFISHRSIDTKRTISGLLHDHLAWLGFNPFLDSHSMAPGDKLFDKIDAAIRDCKVGIAVFSPRFCESDFCLHELALIMESKKKMVPIFCDVKPSELGVMNGSHPPEDLQRYNLALEEAKFTVGLTFDSLKGDWSDFLRKATDAVMKNLLEVVEEERGDRDRKYPHQRSTVGQDYLFSKCEDINI